MGFDGGGKSPFIFILGENHVALNVQQAVADTLGYLRGVYGTKIICTEGWDKPFPPLNKGISLIASRAVAQAELNNRHINGGEYIARYYPDVEVFGIEDLEAQARFHEFFDKEWPKRAKRWQADFNKFLQEEITTLPNLSENDLDQLKGALEQIGNEGGLNHFGKVLHNIVGSDSNIGRKATALIEQGKVFTDKKALEKEMQQQLEERDKIMVSKTLAIAKGKETVALVVGKAHLDTLAQKFKETGISHVTILVAGADIEDDKDITIYNNWKGGKLTPFENWLSKFSKPPPR